MSVQTHYLIKSRREEYQDSVNANSLSSGTGADLEYLRFKSATISGMFVNPFKEYRPQTAFEFVLVRIMEFFESIYGSRFELHNKLPQPHDGAVEVEDILKVLKPNIEKYRANSKILQLCLENNNFQQFFNQDGGNGWLLKGKSSLRNQLLFTWLGQSCTLFQISGINFLTDPIMSDHLFSPSFGPKRLTKSPLSWEDIQYATNNNLNFVLVSHDHPDHLEMSLVNKIRNESYWIVPLGLKKKLAKRGIHKVVELDWWDTLDITNYITTNRKFPDKYEIVCVPSMHWSGRHVTDSNKSLWCSYIVRRNGESLVYHAGDTGYSEELFNVIGAKYQPVTLALLPIGQYCPSWHQKPRHISPQESLKICQQISALFMKGIHWGTFKLSGEPILEPKNLLTALAKSSNKSAFYKAPEFGLTYLIDLNSKKEIELHT
ncbi:hypothetical protein KGF56_001828 [Candida oxycetoniae]|uniref:Metallo-beta-lactamase domain-containing protein n=1 Tax=Candida oxycetoniae TaxID=497107 RepID=A0AAI9WYH8_9ASCO|nr:uncharacterized protein KGF56_001828 [Candida oxycetoniae]KAI3405381.2 hypothetical protein KGF56_001828 [Candida oxycetoniae]